MEDYQDIEEEYMYDGNEQDKFEDDKLCYVLDEMTTFCNQHQLPFLKNNQTYQAFYNVTRKI